MSRQRKLTLISWNSGGFRSKMHELTVLIQDIKPDIIFIQETKLNKLKPTINTRLYNLQFTTDCCGRAAHLREKLVKPNADKH